MKKILFILLALLLVSSNIISLASCDVYDDNTNSDYSEDDNDDNKDENEEENAEEENAEEENAEEENEEENDNQYADLIPSDGLEFTLSDDETSYTVTGIGECTDTDIVIPATYEGLPVKQISNDAFSGYKAMTSIVLPNSITTLESSTFSGCTNLSSIVLGSSLSVINDFAF